VGMISIVFPVLIFVGIILGCDALANEYGIAMAAVGMLSTLGVTLATDAYGPVADNAGGIAEMAELEHRVRETTDALDALGNTTAATGKGFAIGSAVLTALSLLAAFKDKAGILIIDIGEPIVLSGVLIGAMLPFLFAALTMLSVQKAAGAIILEVRRQFAEIPGLREGTADADSDKCVAISTKSSVQEMVLPGLYAVLSPVTVGFLIGPECLTGLLAGSIASGMMLALMMANAGGAWDNSKKYIEIEGAKGGKGTDTHKACVVGDTVGDPFKDTSGPALNILIKLMSMISLTIAPLLKDVKEWEFWYYGLIPLAVMIIGTFLVYHYYWREIPDITADVSEKKVEVIPGKVEGDAAAHEEGEEVESA
jgi:K(+)-stimulated pyrophosphate-energized sodium pump